MKAAANLLASRRRRLLLAGLVAAFPLLFAFRRVSFVPVSSSDDGRHAPDDEGFMLPAPVVEALLHYASSPETPQLTRAELGLAARTLASHHSRRDGPRNLLVFGLGLDTALWAALNHGTGGRTVFLEENATWIDAARAAHPAGLGLEAYHVAYDTVLTDADELLRLRDDPACVARPDLASAAAAGCGLVPMGLPAVFGEVEWDVILVDAPTGYEPNRPGRMGAIYAAGMAARARRRPGETTDVLVHDVDRPVEDVFSRAFLCEAYAVEEVGKLRRFVVPSHRGTDDDDAVPPFCPPPDQDTATV